MSLPTTQETIQVAGIALDNAKEYVVDTLGKAKETVTSTITGSSSGGVPEPPHGTAPSESSPRGTVAYEDKSIAGKISDNIGTLQSSLSSLRRPSLEALFDLHSNAIPQPPHGTPPSDSCPRGIVADEDKTILTKVSETLKDYTPSVTLPPLPLPSWSEYKQEINAFYEQFPSSFAENVNQAQRKLGMPYYVQPGSIPAPPHGQPPSDTNHSGRIAEIDKPITQQLEENWEMLRSEFLGLWGQSKRKLGWTWSTQAGKIPTPPRGTAPSEGSSMGTVDPHDKTLGMQVDELRDVTQQSLDDSIQSLKEKAQVVISQGGRAMGMPYQTQPGVVPEGPHGNPPSEGNSMGVVAEQDKSIPQIAGEALQQLKETTQERVDDVQQGLNNFAVETTTALTGGYL